MRHLIGIEYIIIVGFIVILEGKISIVTTNICYILPLIHPKLFETFYYFITNIYSVNASNNLVRREYIYEYDKI